MSETIQLGDELREEGRFHRQGLIQWWDQDLLAEAKVLLVGAGALGNEILKNLALVGVGSVFVADMDHIEHSNLARSVLFRPGDIGRPKAQVAADRARELFPDMDVTPFVGNIVYDLGMGVFQWADVVICGLDNREARVAVNRRCLLVGRAWSDGAIERLDGTVRFFRPGGGACYECTMNETDWKMLEARRSCTLLSREEMMAGRTPTTATPSSIVAGFQCQQVLKHLHGLPVEAGAGLTLAGLCDEMRPVTYTRREDCTAHESLEQIIALPQRSDEISLRVMLERARSRLGDEAELELSREILHRFECPGCGQKEDVFRSLGQVGEADAPCPECGETRFPLLLHSLGGDEPFVERTPRELGLPPYDMVMGTTLERTIAFLTEGDRAEVLGGVPLAEPATVEADNGDENG